MSASGFAHGAEAIRSDVTVKVQIMDVHNLGYVDTPDGQVSSWKVRFHLDGPNFVTLDLEFPVKGARDKAGASQKGIDALQHFLSEAYAAAKNF